MAKVEELEARLNKNSKNSSKPPSSDGYGKRSIKNSREKSDKSTGGQKGHKGATRSFSKSVNKIVEIKPQTRCECGGEIRINTQNYTVRQEIELGQPQKIIVEYRKFDGVCETCNKVHKATFPKEAEAPVFYGDTLQAMVTYLTQYQLLPLKRTTELMKDLFHIDISQGTIVNVNHEAYVKLEEAERAIKAELLESDVVHFDETGMHVKNELQWLHSAGTKACTLYTIHKKRGKDAMDA